jgi:Fic family protein
LKRKTGTYTVSTTLGEQVKAFVPLPLPPVNPSIEPNHYADLNQKAELAIARLNGVSALVLSVDWFLYSAVRKEALLTSQIEGTQATLVDLLDDESGFGVLNTDDVEEVTNYIQAYRWVQGQLRDPAGLPLSVRLLCESHHRLMSGVRGSDKHPGQLRRSQNWIGGTRPGNAVFVPAPPEQVVELMSNLEKFIHADSDQSDNLPPLVKIALIHAQFETIHPFLDGNGRIGRLLITALLEHWGLMPQPLLYLSSYLKRHQSAYYRHLSAIRNDGDWEAWISFFLEGVITAATDAHKNITAISTLFAQDRKRLLDATHVTPSSYRLFEQLPLMPRFSIEQVRHQLQTSFPTATAAIKILESLGIVKELTGHKKNRYYSYQAYVDLMADDT